MTKGPGDQHVEEPGPTEVSDPLIRQEFKRAAVNDLGFGQTMELLGMTQFIPYGGGMNPLDRAWNDPDLWKRK